MQTQIALAGGTVELSESAASTQKQIPVLTKLTAVLASVRTAIGLWQSRREAIAQLQQLDDYMLADIGIPRSQIEFAVRNGRRPDEIGA
ncbi:MAG: DUF1127 domain-containing protein [Rhodomicrobium sp.]|nr:DUF1127 domain-containing protein [Rhodomicrobium sp.]